MPTLNWIGKEAVEKHHKDVPYRLLEPIVELSCGEEQSGNLIVQGDNLHALKALLPRYAGKVKCIYIDPPYNTGNEKWTYNDNVNSPEIRKWLGETVGKEGETLDRHDRWLCMMYPRLILLKQFLTDDGVIFISIDDNELHNLRLLMNEIFEERNFIANIIWKKKTNGNNVGHIPAVHDYIVTYAKNESSLKLFEVQQSDEYIKSSYSNPDNDSRGPWTTSDLSANHKGPYFEITNPVTGEKFFPPKGRYWVFNEEEVNKRIQEGRIIFGKSGTARPVQRVFLSERETTQKVDTWFDKQGYNADGMKTLSDILGGKVFDHPKPPNLIKFLLNFATDKNSIVMDSFAGSGATAHAVLQKNEEDGGNRKFILIELDENNAKNITSKRVSKVIQGYDFKGKLKKTLSSHKLNFQALKKANTILEDFEKLKAQYSQEFNKIKSEVNDGCLQLVGEVEVDQKMPPLPGDFLYCILSADPLFEANGHIRSNVSFSELAEFVWFCETGTGYTGKADSPLLGIYEGRAIYLLYNGILKDLTEQGGNILTKQVLDVLPKFEGIKVIYAAANRLGGKAKRANIVFKQTPYALEV